MSDTSPEDRGPSDSDSDYYSSDSSYTSDSPGYESDSSGYDADSEYSDYDPTNIRFCDYCEQWYSPDYGCGCL